MAKPVVIDLFSGVGGLTHGFHLEGFDVIAGIDIDKSCKHPYEKNNSPACFINKDIREVTGKELLNKYPTGCIKILVGCAPCQPFSSYARTLKEKDENKWKLLDEFSRLITEVSPDIVSMENVHELQFFKNGETLSKFIETLQRKNYFVYVNPDVHCDSYGIPQRRVRLVLLASKFGPISLLPSTHTRENYKTVRDVIGGLPPIPAGGVDPNDPVHRASSLSNLNLKRIRASKPGGTWRDWDPELIANCHRNENGKTYMSVYGRMKWDDVSPTMTTQCHGYGNGRFGHPEQDRAISLREAALLQTFPRDYEFVAPGDKYHFATLARLIGNAVPVELGRVIACSIKSHLEDFIKVDD